jgi:hypothetical protein
MGPSSACFPRPSFRSTVVFWIAPVGQTSLQSVQLSWQKPTAKSITGVQSPSSPATASFAGCRTFVGQTLMHWSHLMQRSRNSGSATDPGGRIALWWKPRLLTSFEKRRNGNARTPATAVKSQRRRGTSGALTSTASSFEITGRPPRVAVPSFGEPFTRCAIDGRGLKRNLSASSGQSSMQLKQTKHSLLRSAPCGSEAPSHPLRQRSQSVHFVTSRSIRKRAQRERTPRNAPSGQRTRQKNRGMKRFAPTRPRISAPTNQAPAKTRGSGVAGLKRRDEAVVRPWAASAERPQSTAGTIVTVKVLTRRQIGSRRPIWSDPKAAITRKTPRM